MNLFRSLCSAAAICLVSSLIGPPALAQTGVENIPFAGKAGPQQANHEGRTELPMVVHRSISFREIGPAITGGRVTAVAGVPSDPNVYYVGAADGGIFRTNDGGTTWKALFQHEPVASIGALAVDPVNPNIVWAGTGEANIRNDVSYGDGIYKSTDGGAQWKRVGLDQTFQISAIAIDPHHPNTVFVAAMGNPFANNPQRGVYRTTDGGRTWKKVLYIGAGVGISDLAMNPKNPQVLFAAAYQFRRTPWSYSDGGPKDAIYRSIDGGNTWQRLSGHGLPEQPVSRIGLAIAPSSPNIVYAVMGSKEGVLWRSGDGGDRWTLVSKDQEVDVRPFYFSHIAVDPKNPNRIIALSNNLEESTNGGKTFHAIAQQIHVDHHTIWIDPTGSGRIIEGNDGGVALSRDNGAHWAFIHNIAIGQFYHVSVGHGLAYTVCGGLQDNSSWCGPSRSKDPSGIRDRAWYALNGGDGLFAIQAPDKPNLIYNSVENGVFLRFNRTTEQEHDMEPYPRDVVGGGIANVPYRWAWDAGFAVSPQNPKVLYAGANVVFRSEDRGRSWKVISPDLTRNDKSKQQSSGGPIIKDNSGAEYYDAILSIAPSPENPNVIWVGTDDGEVQLTRDGGHTWKNVTANIPNLPPWGRIESIDLPPNEPGAALIAVDRHFSGDFKAYLFRTNDYGATWHSISGNLPDVDAHVVRQDLHNPHMFYAGLENGLYVTWDSGKHWYLFGLGLPSASVYDIALDKATNSLVVATHGRSLWVLDDLTPFEQFTPELARKAAYLFPPETALRYWPWSQVENMGDGAFYGKNPAYGAVFSYYVAHPLNTPGVLTITNAQGKVVRVLRGMHPLAPGAQPSQPGDLPPAAMAGSLMQGDTAQAQQHESRAQQPATPTQKQQQLAPPAKNQKAGAATKVPWVPTTAGLQRIAWDLRANGPVRWHAGKDFEKGPTAGALLPPGEYTAQLTIGGQTMKQKFVVVNDPASHATQSEMEERYRVTESVLHEVSQLDVALNRLDAMHDQLQSLRKAAKAAGDEKVADQAIGSLEKQIKSVESHITSNPGAEESTLRVPDQIREHLTTLDGTLEGEDDAPTPALLAQVKFLRPEYEAAIRDFNRLLSQDVTPFNRKMQQQGLTGVVAGGQLNP